MLHCIYKILIDNFYYQNKPILSSKIQLHILYVVTVIM